MSTRLLLLFSALALILPAGGAVAEDADLERGIRLVDDGDYAEALLVLDAVVKRMEADPQHDRALLARAHLNLGIAYIGLSHEEAARAQFAAALAQVRGLRLSPEQYPPKVIEAFEAARNRQQSRGSSSKPILLGAGAAAAAGVAVLASSGGGSSGAGSAGGGSACTQGRVTFTNARFEVAAFECPVGANGLDDPAGIVVDAVNTTCSTVTITSASTTLTVVASFQTSNSVGQSFFTNPAPVQPSSIAAGGTTVPLRVTSDYVCTNNGSGNAFNEVVGSVTLQTSVGPFTFRTDNTHRSTFP